MLPSGLPRRHTTGSYRRFSWSTCLPSHAPHTLLRLPSSSLSSARATSRRPIDHSTFNTTQGTAPLTSSTSRPSSASLAAFVTATVGQSSIVVVLFLGPYTLRTTTTMFRQIEEGIFNFGSSSLVHTAAPDMACFVTSASRHTAEQAAPLDSLCLLLPV